MVPLTHTALYALPELGTLTVPAGQKVQPLPVEFMTAPLPQLEHTPALAYWAEPQKNGAHVHAAVTTLPEAGTLTYPDGHETHPEPVAFATAPAPHVLHCPDDAICAEPHTLSALVHVPLIELSDAGQRTVPLGHVVQVVPSVDWTCPPPHMLHRPPLAYCAEPHARAALTQVALTALDASGTLALPAVHVTHVLLTATWPSPHAEHWPPETTWAVPQPMAVALLLPHGGEYAVQRTHAVPFGAAVKPELHVLH